MPRIHCISALYGLYSAYTVYLTDKEKRPQNGLYARSMGIVFLYRMHIEYRTQKIYENPLTYKNKYCIIEKGKGYLCEKGA